MKLSRALPRLSSLLLAITLAVALLVPAQAAAGPSRYTFEKCDHVLPGGGVEGIVYGPHPRGLFSSENTCSQPGGALILRQNQIGQGDGGDAVWAVPVVTPPALVLESITVVAAACGVTEPSIWSLEWIQPPGVWPETHCGEDVRSFRLAGESEANFFIELQCVNWAPTEDRCHAGPWIYARNFAITLLDPSAPTLPEPEGSMLTEGVKRGGQGLAARAEVAGGGL
jgi:hypothetical protein